MIGACFEIGFAAAGAELHGLTGTAAGYCSALILEALMFGPTVFGVLRNKRPPRHRIRKGPQADAVRLAIQNSTNTALNQVPPGDVSRNGASGREELAERREWDD